ncbi:SUMO-interacting motif-containing protein 1 [Spea bombifrons]|uniref:SUMO-interacting motif-containing protein 1 n=1 Tax=Spea bombifrons TaxID=233779 RepID=UPI00234BD13E|nr:SUMO-interacting motif-containing protein 1 [Spea bombifrons]
MNNFIVISDDSDSDSATDYREHLVVPERCERQEINQSDLSPDPCTSTSRRKSDLIDLTEKDFAVEISPCQTSSVIDLTGNEDMLEMFPKDHQESPPPFIAKWIKPESHFNNPGLTKESSFIADRDSKIIMDESCSSEEGTGGSSSTTTVNSDMESLQSASEALGELDSSTESRDDCLNYEVNIDSSAEKPQVLQKSQSQAISISAVRMLDSDTMDSGSIPVASSSKVLPPENSYDNPRPSEETPTFNKAWLYKLRYFKKPPVHHLFFQQLRQEQEGRKPIPLRRMNIVYSTKEENFPQGTLHLLTQFVSSYYYPPKDILCHVIRSVLLGKEELSIKNEAYKLLMKVQELHPADLKMVAWDWSLLTEAVEKKEHPAYLLFLQYVVQTLHDDFHIGLRHRSLQKCLAKSMLSCDKSLNNIKDVISWLMEVVMNSDGCSKAEYNSALDCESQRVISLFQHMLYIAVEVDNSPACSSIKIAGYVFPSVISMNTRHQREMFFSSIESPMLKAKILEELFLHSCQKNVTLPLSLAKILFFIEHSTLFLEQQGPGTEWDRWDEMMHHICLLFLSYQRILLDNLLTPVTDRIDQMQKTKQHFQLDDITEDDVETHLDHLKMRISHGAAIPSAIHARLHMLKVLLTSAFRHQA